MSLGARVRASEVYRTDVQADVLPDSKPSAKTGSLVSVSLKNQLEPVLKSRPGFAGADLSAALQVLIYAAL